MKNYETPTFAKLQEMLDEIYPDPPARQPHHRAPSAANNTRMRRALSWLERYPLYEKIENDQDMAGQLVEEQFFCLWLSFNATHGNDDFVVKSQAPYEPKQISNLFRKIWDCCENNAASMNGLICAIGKCKTEIIALAGMPFLYKGFWQAEQNFNPEKYHDWVSADQQNKVHRKKRHEIEEKIEAILQTGVRPEKKNVSDVLTQAFERLRILRNQVMHGSAEYGEEYNRRSIEPGVAVLRTCLPEILHIMLTAMRQNPDDNRWGRVAYPPYLETPDSEEDPPRNN